MITATITTSRRLQLFKQTMASFASNCLDWGLVDSTHVFDDCSSEDDLSEMKNILGDFSTLHPCLVEMAEVSDSVNPVRAALGHAANMRKLHEWLNVHHAMDWLLMLEDDWIMTREGCPIIEALHIMLMRPEVGQVCFGARRSHDLKKHYDTHGPGFTIRPYIIDIKDQYPAYTLNPSLVRVAALQDVGNFADVQWFEKEYGHRWNEKGWKTADLEWPYLLHTGDGNSAYDLNGTKR